MKINLKRLVAAGAAVVLLLLTGCSGSSAADTANENLTKAAENFEVPRSIVGINTRFPDKLLFRVDGFCSYETSPTTIEAICATQDKDRKNHVSRTTIGKSNDVTFVSTQLGGVEVDFFRPRIILRPEALVPNFDLSTSGNPSE